MNTYWVYILASQPRGTLYIGVTNNILGRVELHRAGKGSVFTSRYRVSMLVYFEAFGDIKQAIQREKTLKHYGFYQPCRRKPNLYRIALFERLNIGRFLFLGWRNDQSCARGS